MFRKEFEISRTLARRYISTKTRDGPNSQKRRSRGARLAFRQKRRESGAKARAKRTDVDSDEIVNIIFQQFYCTFYT